MKTKNIRTLLLALISYVVLFLTNICYMLFNWKNILNSDASSELVLADLLNTEGTFISKNWYYSTELRVLNTQFVYKLAFKIFEDNWKYARCFSMAIFMLIILCAAVYIGKELCNLEFGMWASVLMIAPIGKWYANNIIYFSYYVPHIVISLISIAMVLQIAKSTSKCRYLLMCILFILSLIAGMGGIRQIMICYLPLFLAIVVIIICGIFKENTFDLKENLIKNIYLSASSLALVASFIGYVINHKLQYIYRFRSYEVMNWNRFNLSNILNVLGDYLGLIGWNDGTAVMGIAGLGNATALLLMAVMIGSVVYFLRNISDYRKHEKVFGAFYICSFVVMLVCYSSISTYNESYWVPIMPITYIFMMLVINTLLAKSNLIIEIKRLVLSVLAVSVIMCSISTMYYPYVSSVVRYNKDRMAVMEWVASNEYEHVIAPFWESNILTELTNGKIETWTIFKDLEVDHWLQLTSHAEEWPKGKVAVILEKAELTGEYREHEMYPFLVYEDENYLVYNFDEVSVYQKILEE